MYLIEMYLIEKGTPAAGSLFKRADRFNGATAWAYAGRSQCSGKTIIQCVGSGSATPGRCPGTQPRPTLTP